MRSLYLFQWSSAFIENKVYAYDHYNLFKFRESNHEASEIICWQWMILLTSRIQERILVSNGEVKF